METLIPSPNSPRRCWVAGSAGMVGSALVRALRARGDREILATTRADFDLTDAAATRRFLERERPTEAIIAAARVGGIEANRSHPVEFLRENLAIATNTIGLSYETGVGRLLYLGSSCIYPREAPQPIPESALLTGPLEPTNEAYALAKIAGLKLCQYYRRQYGALFHSIMPTNLYGPGDNYHPSHSHVIPALLQRIHEAKANGAASVTIWGTGTPLREFMHVDDLAAACLHVLDLPDPPDWINAGSGEELSILELARLIASVVGFTGEILTDPAMPDGTPRKRVDSSLINQFGWRAAIPLAEGLREVYANWKPENQ
jgi:GDP-L-fucose synthase